MASTIVTKNSSTASAVPVSGDLTQGELAVNVTDKRLFTKNSGGTVVELGINPSSLTMSGGTANGVAYLNGSKVVTTGSALTFDGTTFQYTGAANFATSTGNVGIGTSSPLGTLGIAGSATTTIVIPRSSNGTTGTPVETQLIGSTFTNGSYGTGIYALNAFNSSSANWLTFKTTDVGNGSPVERMRLDSAGNLGLGVTPSAWSSAKAIDVTSWASFGQDSNGYSVVTGNAFYNGTNWVRKQTASAAMYAVDGPSGTHKWSIAGSSTAGSTISFTQAMTLTAAGELAVGTTAALLSGSGRGNITVNGSTDSILALGVAGSWGAYLTANSSNVELASQGSRYMSFSTNGSERARIDSSGNLLVGGTSTNESFAGVPSIQGATNCIFTNRRNSTSSSSQFRFYNPNGMVGEISTSGSATTYATSSDYRLKENIAPMTGALSVVSQLKPVTYTWKADGSAGQGFIAHELQEVVPDCVTGEKDAVDADGNPVYQGIDTSFLVATLTAAIQEQQALIQQLQADVAALKGN